MMPGTSSFLLMLMVGGTGSGQRERLYTAMGLVEGGGKGRGGGLANGEKERMALANDGEGDEKLDGRIERRCGID